MKLTQLVKIASLTPIPEAERIEKAKVLGWDCVVQKGLYQVGDIALFVFPDTLVPKRFLDSSYEGEEKVRLKVVKLKGQYSAGLLIPLDEVKKFLPKDKEIALFEGEDLSEYLGIEKYEKPVPAQLAGQIVGQFPTFLVSKTDEDNYRSNPEAVEEMKRLGEEEIAITVKADGSSGTFLVDPSSNEFRACSRNLMLKEDEKNTFWQVANKYKIEEDIRSSGRNLAIQGEIVGPGVQSNNLGFKEIKFLVFLIKDLDSGSWFSWDEVVNFCRESNYLETVEEIGRLKAADLDFDELQKIADELKYPSGKPAEGLVIRPVRPIPSNSLQKFWLSLKVVSQPYAKKYD